MDAAAPPSVSGMAARQAAALEKFLDFYRDGPPLTLWMLGGMVGVHLGATVWDAVHSKAGWLVTVLGSHSDAALVVFGARSAGRVAQGEFWRLVTSGFVHGDLIHLLVNGLALVGLGRMGEAVFGPPRFFWIFLTSVVGGALLAQMTGSLLSFGASGGLFGVMGALISFSWTRQHLLPAKLVSVFGRHLVGWAALNLLVGLFLPFVSTPSHVGGLITGILVGAFTSDRLTRDQLPSDVPLILASATVLGLSYGSLILR